MTGLGRTAALAAVLLTVTAGAAACGGGGKSGDGTFTMGHSEPDHLTPGNTTSSYSFDVVTNLFDNIEGLTKDGKPYPLAAQSVETTDQKVWTIKLQPGRKFQNGEPVTASSFADAWNWAAYGPNATQANSYFSHLGGYADLNPADEKAKPKADKLSGLQVVDDNTFKVTLDAPFSQFPFLLTYPAYAPMPKAAFKDMKAYDDHPIGNGPYEMDGNWQHNVQIKAKAFDGYQGPRKPHNKGITWKSYASADTAYTDLRAGRIDVLQTIPAAKVPEAKRLLGDRFIAHKKSTIDYLAFPTWDSRYANPKIRQAISMSIDRQGINKAVYNGDYIVADAILPPAIQGHRDNACGELCTYNPAKAKQLFQEAGGFKGTMELYFSNAQPTYYQWMQIVANSLKQNLGITDVQFRQVPASDYFGMLTKHQEKGPYRQNWEADYPSPQNYLENMYGPDNRTGWNNKQFNDLIAKANGAPSQDEAIKDYNQAEDIALQEMPQIPLWTWAGQAGRSSKVDNVTITPYALGLLVDQVTVKK